MELSRRNFIAAGASAAGSLAFSGAYGFFQDRPTLRVGVIGLGGRGSGAIRDSLAGDPGTVVWAIGDAFQDRVTSGVESLEKDFKDRVQVKDRTFTGLDAYQKVIDSGVDVVILTTPPGFRPQHFKAAIDAGKHVFMEKPVAVDGPGVRDVIEAARQAKDKKLTVVAGTQRRHDVAYNEAIKRIRDGQMGDVVSMHCYWNQGGLWSVPKVATMTDAEWQMRNWLYFTWLSGDHIVEQHVHNLDVCNWVKGATPVKALSLGGRQVRLDPVFGHIYDHFATEYEYADGTRMVSMCRQIDGCASRVEEHIVGTKGKSDANTRIRGEQAWRFEGDRPNPYVEEHVRMYKSIRAQEGFNEGAQVAESTLTAIMGRVSAYTGQEVTWEQALNSTENLMPERLAFGELPVPPVAMPGQRVTK
jgi:predicted dehydrogenase